MVVKIPVTQVVSLFVLLAVVTDVVPSNPDSELVQDTEQDELGKRSIGIRSAESRPTLAVITNRYSGVKVLRPYYTNLGIIWREVASNSGEDRIRIRDRGGSLEVSRVNENNGNVPLEPSGGPKGVRPSYGYVPNGNVEVSNVNANGRIVPLEPSGGPRGIRPDANVPNRVIPLPNGNVPSRDTSFAYMFNGNIPIGIVPNGNVPGGNGGNVPNGNVPCGNGDNRRVPDNEFGQTTSGGRDERPPKPNQNNFGDRFRTTKSPGRTSPDANLFASVVNNFAFKLAETMRLESNFVISPISIFVALSMCYLGAEGTTKEQLTRALGLDDYALHGETLHRGISDLLSMISQSPDEYKMFFANGLFFGKNITVEEPYKERVKRFYDAELRNLDFRDQAGSKNAINEWVAKKTMDAIQSVVDRPLDVNTRLLLLNAIFFKGLWKTQFPLNSTKLADFTSLDGRRTKVPFMALHRQTFRQYFSEEHQHTFLKLPYKGDQVSMVIALPLDHGAPPMPNVTDQTLCRVRDAMEDVELNAVLLPRFRLTYAESLSRPLRRMGVDSLFGGSTDLSEMRRQNDVSVSDILHKAVIEVHEKGTKAAAVTTVELVPLSGHGERFVANHPFAFYVVHEASGLVLFYGKVFDVAEDDGNLQVPQINGQVPPPGNGYGNFQDRQVNEQVSPPGNRNGNFQYRQRNRRMSSPVNGN